MNGGWIKIYYKLLNSDMYRDLTSKQRDVMLTCLLLANYKPHQWEWKGKIYSAEKGEFVTSIKSIKKHCGKDVSIKSIRTAINKLEKWQFLAKETTNKNTLIKIVNYKVYQCNDLESGKQSGKQRANKGQLIKNSKELKDLKDKTYAPILKELQKIEIYPFDEEKDFALVSSILKTRKITEAELLDTTESFMLYCEGPYKNKKNKNPRATFKNFFKDFALKKQTKGGFYDVTGNAVQ